MEAAVGASAAMRNGGVLLPQISSSSVHPSRAEWLVVSEQSVRNSGSEEFDRSKLGQCDERLIYEVQLGREPVDVNFCPIIIDGGLNHDILQERLLTLVKQREELQHLEIELRAQLIGRSEIMGMQSNFDTQMKEHANSHVKLQDQLHEKEQKILELERKLDGQERELHAIRLDSETAWAKEDLLREQSKELQCYRRERDNTEVERAQHIKQIHDLQEHIQEKERQNMELQEQHRIAQETILFKDEQLREAQAWITRAQEMDALQSTTSHSLQAELRERTEQYNQLWLGCQRQFAEMERLYIHMQQLQLELTDVKEKSGSYADGSHISQKNSKDSSQLGLSNGSQLELNGNSSPGANNGSLQNGNSESAASFASGGNASMQADHIHGVAFAPSSLLGMPTYLPTGQVAALHPFVMHQQGLLHPSHATQSQFQGIPVISSISNWQNQQTLPDGQHVPIHFPYPQGAEQNLLGTDSYHDSKASVNGQVLHTNYFNANSTRGLDADLVVPSPDGEGQVLDSSDEDYGNAQSQQILLPILSQFHDDLRLSALEHSNDTEEKNVNPVSDHGLENKNTTAELSSLVVNASSSEVPVHAVNCSETTINAASSAVLTDAFVSTGQKNNIVRKPVESYLLDERALLASIARTIGSSGRIRISSTLPNRLGKMLAPLHWHDYKKAYGKLDDFVANHPDLFLIEGDHVQLQEGAQEIIAATAAVAKVAAVTAAAPSSYSSLLPSVTVTPMAQSHRLKKVSSLESSSLNADKVRFSELAVHKPANVADHPSQFSAIQNQNLNGGSFRVAGEVSNVKILNKPKDHVELNGSETRTGQSVLLTVGNGTNSDKISLSQSKVVSHGRPHSSLVGKQQSRVIGAAPSPRR